jgi:chromatin structure-remodeling complex subunit SFH1
VTKRGTAVLSYAEDAYDDDDFEDSDRPRRATGLRSIQRGDEAHSLDKTAQIAALGEELTAPVDLQGIWRDWMGRPKRTL